MINRKETEFQIEEYIKQHSFALEDCSSLRIQIKDRLRINNSLYNQIFKINLSNKIGYLYIIQLESNPDFIKIGITENLDRRIRSYNSSSPFNSKVLYSTELRNPIILEKSLKRNFGEWCIEGRTEWFHNKEDLLKKMIKHIESSLVIDNQLYSI